MHQLVLILVALLLAAPAAAEPDELSRAILVAICPCRRTSWPMDSDLDARGELGAPLHVAALMGDAAAARLLLDHGANIAVRTEGYAMTPLHVAASYGRAELAELLLARGAAVEGLYIGGPPPLVEAARSGDTEMIKLLVKRGADPNADDGNGKTPLRRRPPRAMTQPSPCCANSARADSEYHRRRACEPRTLARRTDKGPYRPCANLSADGGSLEQAWVAATRHDRRVELPRPGLKGSDHAAYRLVEQQADQVLKIRDLNSKST